MKFEKVLVTGGLGLIGSHLVESLASRSVRIIVLDNQTSGTPENIRAVSVDSNIEVVIGDITDEVLVDNLMQKVDFCFHLAATLGVKKILEQPLLALKTNVHGSENVLSAAAKYSVPIFLASTSEVYGDNPNQPLSEDSNRVLGSPLSIRWTYSEAKAIDESLAQIYHYEKGLRFIIGRFFNTVGPRQLGEYGMVLPRFAKAAISGADLEVYGDGTQTRVFCHVKDAVEAILTLVECPSAWNDVFNIGGTGEISIGELASMVVEQAKSNSTIRYKSYSEAYSRGFQETFRRVPDIKKIHEVTGWKPRHTLNQIVEDVLKYAKSQS